MTNLIKKLWDTIPTKTKVNLGATALAIASPFILKAQDMEHVKLKSKNSKDFTYKTIELGDVKYLIKPDSNAPCGFLWAYEGYDVDKSFDIKGNLKETVNWIKGLNTNYESLDISSCTPTSNIYSNTNPKKCKIPKKTTESQKIPKIGYLEFTEQNGEQMGFNLIEIGGKYYQGFYQIDEKTRYNLPNEDDKWKYQIVNSKFCIVPPKNLK
ncbi:MAG: hypothetical protein U9Q99_01215 [Nanoarchaeota archaeon]|nr:hypothetical protein [Nanoarchaeota archaeon]